MAGLSWQAIHWQAFHGLQVPSKQVDNADWRIVVCETQGCPLL